jgi:hypothetical protein
MTLAYQDLPVEAITEGELNTLYYLSPNIS